MPTILCELTGTAFLFSSSAPGTLNPEDTSQPRVELCTKETLLTDPSSRPKFTAALKAVVEAAKKKQKSHQSPKLVEFRAVAST